jgi:hypothetical protein
MEWVTLVGAGLQIVLLIFKEFMSASARAREEDKTFKLDQAALKLIVDEAVRKWNSSNAKDSDGSSDAWDKADDKK